MAPIGTWELLVSKLTLYPAPKILKVVAREFLTFLYKTLLLLPSFLEIMPEKSVIKKNLKCQYARIQFQY
jgi:hypothetical protein